VAQLGSTTTPGSTTSQTGSEQQSALAWAHCMRSSGVQDLPDPTGSNVKIPTAQQLGVSSSQLQTAESTCRHLLANGGSGPNPAQLEQEMDSMRTFADCLRSHGIANWPDPTVGPQGRPEFKLVGARGIPDPSSPQLQNAIHDCGHLVPTAVGGIPVSSP
jgi:hypothetical protein